MSSNDFEINRERTAHQAGEWRFGLRDEDVDLQLVHEDAPDVSSEEPPTEATAG